MSRFYTTDPDDPDAPVELAEYRGLLPGMSVTYAGRHPLNGPLIVTELIRFPAYLDLDHHVTAILNDGEWEVDADNLRPVEG